MTAVERALLAVVVFAAAASTLMSCADTSARILGRHYSNIWRHQKRQTTGGSGWRDLDYGNLTDAIRDIIVAMAVDCSTLAVHSAFRRHPGRGENGKTKVLRSVFDVGTDGEHTEHHPEEQPHVSGRGLRVPVAPVDCQPNVQVRHIRGDARVRHHQSQAGIKPPWMFVEYLNDSFRVDGGRDDKLINLLADKLNFRFTYVDPPDRTQGSGLDRGSSMQGVLGLIGQREADWFVGDLSITYERNLVVDFSFLTLVDNEAFLTHAPGRLNEAFSLIRPFHWSVWPLLLITVVFAGPILYILIDSTDGHPQGKSLLYWKCVWWSVTVFLQQAAIIPSDNNKIRFVAGLLMLTATYVIGDMYSASLTSILARPPKEPPINTLDELSKAMRDSGLQLLVEVQSASQAMLENGTGVYEELSMLVSHQQEYLIGSTEKGMQLVRDNKNYAVIGGRETFYYDIKRFGAQHFHLSEKLNTRYSAIAFQRACPYRDNFNDVLMRLFEGGILSKITEEEYQKLNDKLMGSEKYDATSVVVEPVLEGSEPRQDDDDKQLTIAMSMKTLQGAFYVLAIGSMLAGLLLLIEIRSYGKLKNDEHIKNERLIAPFVYKRKLPRKFQSGLYNIVE
ncbi:ionotropic receptor 40a isoform X4 [Sipha flava]|uniref:Ionotropic receptor 40a isoform X4 n=1 Tax=Sipha flava TaxID=143950 RepID=A0A8B8FCH5_9HEMI|nr:ionotropic receptor 40a isoform X4 [Sipha flava]